MSERSIERGKVASWILSNWDRYQLLQIAEFFFIFDIIEKHRNLKPSLDAALWVTFAWSFVCRKIFFSRIDHRRRNNKLKKSSCIFQRKCFHIFQCQNVFLCHSLEKKMHSLLFWSVSLAFFSNQNSSTFCFLAKNINVTRVWLKYDVWESSRVVANLNDGRWMKCGAL